MLHVCVFVCTLNSSEPNKLLSVNMFLILVPVLVDSVRPSLKVRLYFLFAPLASQILLYLYHSVNVK